MATMARRLIPARAGRIQALAAHLPTDPAHPRSRGANSIATTELCHQRGSSPLARGESVLARPGWHLGGLIPARAGRIGHVWSSLIAGPAHPRSRGANERFGEGKLACLGSSPLARGESGIRPREDFCTGLIPARAGRMPRGPRRPRRPRAHPRSRGANRSPSGGPARGMGSSPLARGE